MFSSFKLPTLRPRTRSLSSPSKSEFSILCKPPRTPVGSPKDKKNRKSHFFKKGDPDLGSTPSISSQRPGSISLTSNHSIPSDRIHSINVVKTTRMRQFEETRFLSNVDGNRSIEGGYFLPQQDSLSSLNVASKIAEVVIEKTDGSIGITLKGGVIHERPDLSKPFTITHVRTNGPAGRTGLIRVGDKVLKVNNHSLVDKTLKEAQQLLQCIGSKGKTNVTVLTVEYEVGIMESLKYTTGPLLIEMERNAEENFGVILGICNDNNCLPDEILNLEFFINHITPASTADRCGALNVGDQILAIDDIMLDSFFGSIEDAEKLLKKAKKLQVMPFHLSQRNSRVYGYASQLHNPIEGFSTINSNRSRKKNTINRQSGLLKSLDGDDYGSNCYGYFNHMGVCHPEALCVSLIRDPNLGFGVSVTVGDHSNIKSADILINKIYADSPAYRCGCLQVGDRILAINHQFNLTLQEINSLLNSAEDGTNPINQIMLEVEFDVADTIIPSSGIFTVNLANSAPGLGITITASKIAPEDPFIISEIKRGSTAHRTGTLHAGDRLLAIDNQPLTHQTIESTFEILKNSINEIVTLKIEKTETENDNLFLDSIVYTVELHRYGGPLGITISGSEDSLEPIVLSKILEGGLADKTGTLHVGDRILAINGESLEHKTLSHAIRVLQNSGDRVQLKIARNLKPSAQNTQEDRNDYSIPDGVRSVDSAIHSWDSNNPDQDNVDISEIKDGESIISEATSLPYQEKGTSISMSGKHDSQLQFYSDVEDISYCPSPLPLPSYNNTLKYENRYQKIHNYYGNRLQESYSHESLLGSEVYHVTLYKDSIYDDYGFSVSDGLYEKGVYVNKIRKDGPADIVGLLKPYDRIIQVNDTKTLDFDCCLTVPLIASAGDRIELVISRSNDSTYSGKKSIENVSEVAPFPQYQNTITKTL